MLSRGSTLHTHHKFDFDLYSHRVPFVISWPICSSEHKFVTSGWHRSLLWNLCFLKSTRHSCFCTCADPGIFVRGVQVNLTKKLRQRFFLFVFFFYSSAYFTEVKWLISKKTIIFQGSRGGPTFSRGGGPTFSRGSNCLFPIETHITCDFPGGGPDPCPPPLWIHTCCTPLLY